MRGREVGFADDTLLARLLLDELLRGDEVDVRDLLRHARECEVEQRELALAAFLHPADHAGEQVAQHGHDAEVVVDEAELDVEGHVLREVADGVVRFGPEHGTDLVHALEHADHHLLVELRRLREITGAAEVVDAKDVGARLRRGRDDLRRLDLDETGGVERLAHPGQRQRAEPEHRTAARVAQRDGRVVELERQLFLQLGHAAG